MLTDAPQFRSVSFAEFGVIDLPTASFKGLSVLRRFGVRGFPENPTSQSLTRASSVQAASRGNCPFVSPIRTNQGRTNSRIDLSDSSWNQDVGQDPDRDRKGVGCIAQFP